MRLFGVQLICTVTMGGGRILPIPSSKSYILIFTTLPALIVFIVEMWRTWAFSSEKTHHLVLRWYEKAKATAARWARVGIQSKGSPTVPVTTSVSHPVELGRPPRLVLRPRTEDGAGENGRGEEDAEGMGADEREDDADEPFQKRIRMIEAAETELTKSIVASCEKFEVGLGNPVLNHVGIWIAYITELSLQLNTDPLLAMDLNLLCMVAEIVAFILIPLMALLYHANQIEESLAQLSRVQEARRVAALEVAGYRSRRAFLKYIFFELREPFHRMQLGLEALGATAVRLAPEKVETIGMMQTAAESMSSVMDSVMTLSQFEETAFQLHTVPLEIRDVMDTIVLQFSPWAKQANISLARIVDPAVPSMLAIDRVKMIQVCCNFISNALKVLGARSEGVMHQVDDGFDGGRANSQRKSGSVVLAVRLLADVPTEPIGDQTEVLDDHAMMALLQSKAREEMDHYRSLLIRGQMDPRRTDVNILGGSVASTSRERPHSVLFGPCRRPAGISLSQGYVQAIAGALSKRTLEHGRGRIVKSTTSKSEEDDPQNDSDLGDEGRDGSTSGNDASASTPTATASTAAASPMSIDMAASTSGMPHCTGRARSRRNVIPATPTGTAFTGREVVLSISVLDDGPGMGSESLSKLFQPFHSSLAGSTDAPIVTAGAGLGLAISRELVAASGGFIGCLSQLGRGTAFVCVLPLRLYRRTS
jgi:signal transduction histidine kinase